MKFIIERSSSGFLDYKKPCMESRAASVVYVDRRTVKTLRQARREHWGKDFFARGTNHREENGMVSRDLEEHKIWIIEINTLEQLLKLEGRYGKLIIKDVGEYKGYSLAIEIYDSWRE